jgi:DNA-binding phage protein
MTTRDAEGYLARRLRDPAYEAEYVRERARVDAIDSIVRALDDARNKQGLSKAELARLVDKRADFLRRLFTAAHPNPTLETVVEIAAALDLEVRLEARS